MKTASEWLDEYSKNHLNPTNRRFHFICIPLIVFSIVCALKAIPVGNDWINPASITICAAFVYFCFLSWRLAIGFLVAIAVLYRSALFLESVFQNNFIWLAIIIFVVGWIGQFIGHKIEGARPAFFKDIQFLLIGPLWEIAHLYGALGLAIDSGSKPTATGQ